MMRYLWDSKYTQRHQWFKPNTTGNECTFFKEADASSQPSFPDLSDYPIVGISFSNYDTAILQVHAQDDKLSGKIGLLDFLRNVGSDTFKNEWIIQKVKCLVQEST